jgi:hypothetical protein
MRSFVIDSFSGLSDFEGKGTKGSFKFGKSLDVRKRVDSLSCQQAFTNLSPDITSELMNYMVPAPDSNMYAFGNSKVYKIAEDFATSLVYSSLSTGIDGAGIGYESTGKYYIYWVTGTTLHRKELPGLSNWTDVDVDSGWPKTGLQDVEYHTMAWINGSLLICNGQYIAMVGYDGSYTSNALDLGKENLATTLLERDGYAIIGTSRSDLVDKAEIIMWDTSSLSWNRKKIIPSGRISGLVDTDLTLLETPGPTSNIQNAKLFLSDFINMIPIASFPLDATGGLILNPESVDVDGGLALFGMCDGDMYAQDRSTNGIYTYGRKDKNSPYALNLEYSLDCDYIKSVKKWAGAIFVAYRQPTGAGYNNKVQVIDYENKATAVYGSLDLKVPPDLPARPAVWNMVKLLTAPIVSGTSISLKYKINKSGSWITAYLQDGTSSFDDVGETEAVFLVGAEGKIFEFQITLTPTGNTSPEIYRVEVFFT